MTRDEKNQEEMWKKSFEFLKDHLSPETVEKYGPLPENTSAQHESMGCRLCQNLNPCGICFPSRNLWN